MIKKLELTVQMLSPLWAAGAAGKCDRLHETGIIGSLRWWYEAIVRGLDGCYACDPASESRCELSGKEKSDEERRAKLCPACRLFGCGGWKRRFRLVAGAGSTEPFTLASLFYKNKSNEDEFNRWWLNEIFESNLADRLAFGKVTLTFIFPAGTDGEESLNQIKALLSVMAHCGSIGAKGQYGFGQFAWEGKTKLETALKDIQSFILGRQFKESKNENDWYSLEKFWYINIPLMDDNAQIKRFEKARLEQEKSIGPTTGKLYLPVSFDIRYKLKGGGKWSGLRQAYYQKQFEETNNDKKQTEKKTRLIFGGQWHEGSDQHRQGSRVFVSHPYKHGPGDENYKLRVWGFTDESVAEVVKKELQNIFGLNDTPEYTTGLSLIAKLQQKNREGYEHEV